MASSQDLSSNSITIIVKAPNQKVTDQTLKVEPNWRIKDLKSHISQVYPGAPDVLKQKLIYSGKLLSDELILDELLTKTEENPNHIHTMHLVCPNSNLTNKSSGPSSKSQPSTSSTATSSTDANIDCAQFLRNRFGLNEQDLPRLYQEYYLYLQSYYYQQACSNWMQSTSQSATFPTTQSTPAADNNAEPPLANQANPPPPVRQENNAAPPAPAQDGNQIGRFLGGIMDGGDMEAEQPRDFLDYIYLAVRITLLLFIIHYYSSAEKVVVSLLLFLVFYLLQRFILVRRNFPIGIRVRVALRRPAPENENGGAEHDNENGNVRQEGVAVNNEQFDGSRFALVLDALRIALETIFSFFTSLIPDRPPPINVN